MFAFIAVPGFVMYVAGLLFFLESISLQRPGMGMAALVGIICGASAMLYGTGKWGQWLFVLPVALSPVVFFAAAGAVVFAFGAMSVIDALVVGGIVAIVTLILLSRRIERHYARD